MDTFHSTFAQTIHTKRSKIRRSSRPDLKVGLETVKHHLPLGLILPKVPEESFLTRMILITSYSLQRIFMHHRNT